MQQKWYQAYNKKERWTIFSIIALIIIGLASWQILYHNNTARASIIEEPEMLSEWNEIQDKLPNTDVKDNGDLSHLSTADRMSNKSGSYQKDELLNSIPFNPQTFNPNEASIETMIAAGVPIHSAKRIIKYRNKGGVFYKKEKLKDFGFSNEEFSKVEKYILIPNQNNRSEHNYTYRNYEQKEYSKPQEPTALNINLASAEELMKFKGIGPSFSKRIIEYRNKLGGFNKIDQLKEVYGLPDSTFLHIKDKIVVDKDIVDKLNINTASESELANHPYIGKYLAANIIKLRNDISQFNNLNELRQVPLINEEKYRKIVPYLKLN